jgi:pre-peptidase
MLRSRNVFAVLAVTSLVSPAAFPAAPTSGSVSSVGRSSQWQGKTFVASDPTSLVGNEAGVDLGCRNNLTRALDPACDTYKLTVVPAAGNYAVDISTQAADGNDFDLFVFNSAGSLIGISSGETGNERVTLTNLAAGTYDVVVEAWLVVPGATYAGTVALTPVIAEDQTARFYRGTRVPPGFTGIPANVGVKGSGQPLEVRATYIGREAAEPTIGVNRSGTAFFAASAFDSLPEESPVQTARTEVMRSRDGGASWHSVQPALPVGETTEPPTNLDPYIWVDEDTGRLFSLDLYAACGYLLFSDSEGETWTRSPLACGDYVNDHQTLFGGKPPANLQTVGYPKVLYYCFNRVADSPCGRSLDGGLTWLPTLEPSFRGVDTEGGLCGGLHGHGVSDSQGRIFIPKGHCASPAVAMSANGGDSWTRTMVSSHLPPADTQVVATVDAADNVYVLWWDDANHLPYVSISRDHGATWSTPLMVAPPGVKEVNLPSMVAGDAGRVAISFPGTTSNAHGDLQRPWDFYVVVSTNMLDADPLFTWKRVNPAGDPIHRGNCGPGRCAGMFDFLDIALSPNDGGFWATAVDTCTGACVTNAEEADGAQGVAIRQLKGPWLRAARRR